MTNLSELVAFELHEAWRRPRLREDGTYEPRWKKIKDETFIENLKKNVKFGENNIKSAVPKKNKWLVKMLKVGTNVD